MGSLHILNTRRVVLAALALSFAALAGATTSVTYTGAGTFSLISGKDTFELATHPFSFSVTGLEGAVPTVTGPSWSEYKGLALKATIQSGVSPSPITITNNNGNIVLATGNPAYDFFTLGSGIKVVGLPIGILAKIAMAKGTLTNTQILPFTHGVTLAPSNATLTYSSTVNGVPEATTLGITGTFFTVVSAPPAGSTALMLHSAGAQMVTSHGDGTTSVRSVSGTRVDLGASTGKVSLRLYASGLRDASEVHVQIGGEDVQVLYAGAAGHFAGLDEITVQLPRSLAGRGEVDVTLTVDGHKADPIRMNIQ